MGIKSIAMKIILYIALILLSAFNASSQSKYSIKEFNLSIQFSQVRKFDLYNGICYLYKSHHDFIKINFKLSRREKRTICNQYYSLGLDSLKNEKEYIDSCFYVPKNHTTLNFKIENKNKMIKIDKNCDNFNQSDSSSARQVQKYILIVEKILQSKKEIRNAPKGNSLIM